MDTFEEELLNFWRVLNQNQVRYIMVGGFAVRFNGFNRNTDDIDLWLEDTLLNRQLLRKSFSDLEYGDYPSLETMVFVPGWASFYISFGVELDIMTSMKGLEDQSFDDCYQRSNIADFEGIKVPFLHISDLLTNKKAVDRSQDQIDVIELEKIQKIQEKGQGNK
jgi:hypothetical protein